ncbi:MAG: 5-formyltetrahydrofolate cyclo-ligase [Pseudomonadota bacterium]
MEAQVVIKEQAQARWAGRHADKDRLRHDVWQALENTGEGVGSPWSAIPNFRGSRQAAERLRELPMWSESQVVKVNPDRAQAWVRRLALEDGKRVYTPIPELVEDFPFLLLDPLQLSAQRAGFHDVMYSEGALTYGQPVGFDEIEPIDICVVGSVAVAENGGRTGKGAGFADLEMGIFRTLGILPETCPVITTISEIQLVPAARVVIEAHDTPLDWIVTPQRSLRVTTGHTRPGPVDWSKVREDQFRSIPFLCALRDQLSP